jgi:DNA adenine methylase
LSLDVQQPERPVLRYHGGKWRLAPWLISLFPPHRIYVEPFGGGASVLMRKPRCYAEVYNDRWDVVVNVFRVLRDKDKARLLAEALRLTPYARTEFIESYIRDTDSDVERARLTILRSFAGFGSASTNGDFATGFRANSNRSGTTPAHDWVNYPDVIPAFVDRLAGVCIENKPAIEVIEQHDSKETLFYLDPPYPHSTRNMQRGNAAYACEMMDEDHRELAQRLHSIRGMALISGYSCELYDELYGDWPCTEKETMADGDRPRQEVVWMNAACYAQQKQQYLFNEETLK